MEIAFVTYTTVPTQAVWIKRVIENLKIGLLEGLVDIFSDNKAAISSTKSDVTSTLGALIDINYRYAKGYGREKENESWLHFLRENDS